MTGMPASLGWPAQGQRDMCLMRARSETSTRMSNRQQPWSDDVVRHGRILVLSDNPISRSIAAIASTAGRTVLVEPADDGGPGLAPLPGDAAMMASRGRAAGLLDDLAAEGADVSALHVPAGHDLGGKAPGEIALSVVAEIVAESYGRPGGPMRG